MSTHNTYFVRTFGCQMNKHDSERIAGMLEARGMTVATSPETADVVVFNTCAVRENAEVRLRGQVSSLKSAKDGRPDMLIAVGGCVPQSDATGLAAALAHVDVVFGTHNIADLPAMLEQAAASRTSQVRVASSTDAFASDLPTARERPWSAWLPITVGCDNRCSYCIVPDVRGPERSRDFDEIVAEARGLVADGVLEITLLGQNVNSYGRDRYGQPRFAELLRNVAAESGVEWLRFTTSHPKDLSQDTIAAMADTPQVCRYLHLPVQSGSDRILALMRRVYTQESYLALVGRLREAMPDLALSTDVIVGFPGETEADFGETMRVVDEAHFDQAFTFIYSPRRGTPAAELPGRIPKAMIQARFDRLVGAVHASAHASNQVYVGTRQRVLLEGASDRDAAWLKGRTSSNKVVHAPVHADVDADSLAGTFAQVDIAEAQTWFLRGTVRG